MQRYAESTSNSRDSGNFGALVGKYAIRRDDVKLFETFSDVLGKAAGTSLVFGTETILSTKIALCLALIAMVRQFWNRGVFVKDKDKLRLLTILQFNSSNVGQIGLTTEQIVEILTRTASLESSIVERLLQELSAEPSPDGGTAALVSRDAEGRWRSHV